MRDALLLSGAAARWALHCYRRHFVLVFGLSVIPSGQRFLVVNYDVDPVLAVGSEILVALVRLLLVVLVVRIMLRELAAAGIDRRAAWSRLRAGIDTRRTAFWSQWAVLALAFTVFDVIPTLIVDTAVPAADRDTVTAVMLAVKNPTIIVFTMLWLIGIGQALITSTEQRKPVAA